MLACDASFTAEQEAKVAPLAIAMFLKYNSDPLITSLAQDIFKVFASNPTCSAAIQARLVPPLVSILNAAEDKSGLKSVALDVLSSLVRSSPLPLSDQLMLNLFPVAIQVTLTTDDNSVLQSGGECLRSYIAVSPDQILAFTDPNGKSGVVHILAVAEHLLNPTSSEFSATFVGKLVTTLIQKVGNRLGDHLDLLLKAVLSKLQGSQTLTVIQSLIMVYAHLVHSQLEAVLNFLTSVPGPMGNSALHFVMTEWVGRQQAFFGSYETKVCVMALGKLLQHGVNTNDSRLMEIMVKGDQIHSSARATRSQSKPEQWTQIPLLAKLFKILVNEMQSIFEEVEEVEEDVSEDEGWEDSQDSQDSDSSFHATNGAAGSGDGKIDLSKLLAPAEEYLEDSEDEDPENRADPLYAVDLKQYLMNFLREFCVQPYFPQHFAAHLTPTEQKTLQTLQNLSNSAS